MSAFSLDDPTLALIARFAACCEDPAVSEDAFLRQQRDQIREYVESYPSEQRQERALEWIMRNAEVYRRKWHENVVVDQAPNSQCPDCPMERRQQAGTCEIHERWLGLLNDYVSRKVSSEAYVSESLDLLRLHKEKLRKLAP